VVRVVVTLNVVVLNLWRRDNFDRPGVALALVVVMVAWTAFAIWAYGAAARRRPLLLLADLAIAVVMLAATPLVKGDSFNATLPGFWIVGALLAWAIHWRWWGGLVAAGCLSAVDLAIRPEIVQTNYANVFLIMVAGPIVGYLCQSLVEMAAERDRALRSAAAASERARLARAVHDGVLQVLSLVQRRGLELGGDFGRLGALAGEQETQLRSLIRQQDAVEANPSDTVRDLGADLQRLASPRISVATPAAPVRVGSARAHEVAAVVRACLDNVARHVGDDAPAWVLLDVIGSDVVVSVRDDGPGIPPGRLETAAAEGRLGVAQSIRGRMADLGGTASLDTGSRGTEWELSLPR
jgi:signal transduction histidine kinase